MFNQKLNLKAEVYALLLRNTGLNLLKKTTAFPLFRLGILVTPAESDY
jgi:hypothetical protein